MELAEYCNQDDKLQITRQLWWIERVREISICKLRSSSRSLIQLFRNFNYGIFIVIIVILMFKKQKMVCLIKSRGRSIITSKFKNAFVIT